MVFPLAKALETAAASKAITSVGGLPVAPDIVAIGRQRSGSKFRMFIIRDQHNKDQRPVSIGDNHDVPVPAWRQVKREDGWVGETCLSSSERSKLSTNHAVCMSSSGSFRPREEIFRRGCEATCVVFRRH